MFTFYWQCLGEIGDTNNFLDLARSMYTTINLVKELICENLVQSAWLNFCVTIPSNLMASHLWQRFHLDGDSKNLHGEEMLRELRMAPTIHLKTCGHVQKNFPDKIRITFQCHRRCVFHIFFPTSFPTSPAWLVETYLRKNPCPSSLEWWRSSSSWRQLITWWLPRSRETQQRDGLCDGLGDGFVLLVFSLIFWQN